MQNTCKIMSLTIEQNQLVSKMSGSACTWIDKWLIHGKTPERMVTDNQL